MPRNLYVTLGDGREVEYKNVPDNVTDAQVRQRAYGKYSSVGLKASKPRTTAPATPRSASRTKQSFGRDLSIAGRGVVEGLTETAGSLIPASPFVLQNYATQASNKVAKLLGLPFVEPGGKFDMPGSGGAMDPTTMGTRAGSTYATGAGLAKPETDRERLALAASKAATQALLPNPGGKVQAGASLLRRVAATAVPKAIDMGTGAIAGYTGEALRQRGASPTTQAIASLLAGVAPTAAVNTVARPATKLWSYSKWGDETERAAEELTKHTTNPAQAIRNIEKYQTANPVPTIGPTDIRPTTGGIAGDTQLGAFEKQIETTGIKDQKWVNAQQRSKRIAGTLSGGDPTALNRAAAAEEAANQAALASRVEGIAPNTDRRAQGVQLGGEVGTSGTNAGEVGTAYAGARTASRNAYNVPEITEVAPITLSDQFVPNMTKTLTDAFGKWKGGVPRRVRRALSNIIDNEGNLVSNTTDTEHVQNLITRLRGYAGEAATKGNKPQADAIDAVIDSLGAEVGSQMSGPRTAALDAAAATRLSQGQTFEQGPLAEATGKGRYNEPNVYPTELPGAVVQPGARGGTLADQLTAAIGSKSAERHARLELRRIIDEGGDVTPETLGDFGETLKRYPGLETEVRGLREHAAANAAFLDTPLGKMTDTTGRKGVNANIKDLLTADNDQPFKDFLGAAQKHGDDAMNGLRQSLSNYITKQGGDKVEDQFGNLVPDNDKQLKAVRTVLTRAGSALTDEQRTVLGAMEKQMSNVKFAGKAGKPIKGDRVGRDVPFESFYARLTNFLANHFNNTEARDKLLERAIMDPSIAVRLLKEEPKNRWGRTGRSIARAVTAGSVAASSPGQPEE